VLYQGVAHGSCHLLGPQLWMGRTRFPTLSQQSSNARHELVGPDECLLAASSGSRSAPDNHAAIVDGLRHPLAVHDGVRPGEREAGWLLQQGACK
jgi:hypothetical protein